MIEPSSRRPLKVRGLAVSQNIARWLAEQSVTPNAISMTSVLFAALAGACLLALPGARGWQAHALPLAAAAFIQLRLLCNLFDGMVAVEGGKGTPSGELFNDIPDRIADPVILVCAGYAASGIDGATALGWAAGILSVMTAYVRTLATSMGSPTDFRGPMAKQHRMALMTGALVLTSAEPLLWSQGPVLVGALVVVVLGTIVTAWRRAHAAYSWLEGDR